MTSELTDYQRALLTAARDGQLGRDDWGWWYASDGTRVLVAGRDEVAHQLLTAGLLAKTGSPGSPAVELTDLGRAALDGTQ